MKEHQKEAKRKNMFLSTLNAPCIELSGNRELLIEGSKGVLEYATDSVRINTGGMIVNVAGRELNLRCISDSALIIDGFIISLSFTV
ncbi:YabP/YqfC family sporulation protein [Ruminococcus sp.]|jgi:sporulation protein YqfC|uniref:YabP/YqfC family sporulation protein n=1 Tax=Ruminococcus sp. TaxID=41978 RepID=UPI0038699E5C